MIKVSVIIPVYNTEKYLKRCLDSVVNQTLKDIEIICINDCSTDGSLSVLEEYAKNDSRTKIINLSQNQGAANARNLGIDSAKGEYIGFIDSDDFIDLDFYEKLYIKAKENNSDIAKCSYKYMSTDFVEENINMKIKENKNNFCSEYCSAIFKKALIQDNKIHFPLISEMEDPVFAFLCALNANDIQITDNLFVYIEEREDSLTRSYITESRLRDKIYGIEKIIDIANENNIEKGCYAYVTAIWFGNLFLEFREIGIELRIIIASEVERLYEKILYKNMFCSVLNIYNPFLSHLLLNKKFQDVIFYNELKLIDEQTKKIRELEHSNSVLEDCYTDVVKGYAAKTLQNIKGEDIYFISVVNNYDMYKKCIKENPFVYFPQNIKTVNFDNTKENIPIPIRYNSFLDSYDYSNSAWFVFCHCDWELMDNINSVLSQLDKNFLYGPVGSRIEKVDNKIFRLFTGQCFERRRDGTGFRQIGNKNFSKELTDTFDCQALIVHSSLINKTNLRFDENLLWDLYVEDFCIQAKENHNINSYAINLKCCHWSGYHKLPKSYVTSLLYMNKKYSGRIYSGTVSSIGNNKLELMSNKDYIFHKLRNKVKNSLKNKDIKC